MKVISKYINVTMTNSAKINKHVCSRKHAVNRKEFNMSEEINEVSLKIIALENVKSEVQIHIGNNRPITWSAKLVKGKEFQMNVDGKEKTVYAMNLVQQPLLYLLAARFTDTDDVTDEEADRSALQKVFKPAVFDQLMNMVTFTESVSTMMQNNNLIVDNPKYTISDNEE